jgi:hypothetical protein
MHSLEKARAKDVLVLKNDKETLPKKVYIVDLGFIIEELCIAEERALHM